MDRLEQIVSRLGWSPAGRDDGAGSRQPGEARAEQPGGEVLTGDDAWGRLAREALARLEPAERTAWETLLAHAATAQAPRPTRPWLKRARELAAAVGKERCEATMVAWLGLLDQSGGNRRRLEARADDRRDIHGHPAPDSVLSDQNGTVLKGLGWCCAVLDGDAVAAAVGRAAEACFRKVPGVGPRSTKAGNAFVYALGAMPGMAAVIALVGLRERLTYDAARRSIAAALEAAAKREGLTLDDLEDLAVPTFGLEDGRLRCPVGPYVAEIGVVGSQRVEVGWIKPDGTTQQTVPTALKREFAAELKAVKRTADEIGRALATQRDRIERLLMSERSWALATWRERYLNHPLLASLSRRLIWSFQEGERVALGAWRDGAIVGVDDEPLTWLTDESRVRLWHPVGWDAQTVLAWQRWLEGHEVTQPFKQAHREVYVPTDAELATATYSNRFAAHILRQHQLQALCRQRGWAYRLQGTFDSWNAPTLELPAWGLAAEFHVEGAFENRHVSDAGICLYVATDQVRFTRLFAAQPAAQPRTPEAVIGRFTDFAYGQPVPLTEVPTPVFTEVMRDVDLFVSVCSIGNDPTWHDRGPTDVDRPWAGYWQDYAFGELSATAQTRRAVLERLLPRLAIADRCGLTDRFLTVRGDLRTYKIHLGSGNVMMEPNNQYLCIVPDRAADSRVYLPFEGDGLLSVVLSKAFLLANDRAITDPTITRQIVAG